MCDCELLKFSAHYWLVQRIIFILLFTITQVNKLWNLMWKWLCRKYCLDKFNSNKVYTIAKQLPILRYTYAAGETFLCWFGTQPRICISDPELAKQILSNKFGFYVKPSTTPPVQILVGSKGLVLISGLDWAKHRRIINPAFSLDKLKVRNPASLNLFFHFLFAHNLSMFNIL